MKGSMKTIVAGAVPAVCGALTVSTLGEGIAWPERPTLQHSFQVAIKATEPAISADQVLVQRELELRRVAELQAALRAEAQRAVQEQAVVNGVRP